MGMILNRKPRFHHYRKENQPKPFTNCVYGNLALVSTLDPIDQFRYIKIQAKTMDLGTRLVGINPTNSVVIPKSLVLKSIVLA